MTLAGTETAEIFGLGDAFPQPGWVVLDAARDHRYTGELVFDVLPSVQVYFDRGLIYLAERVNDPTLGSRLVDAGALSSVQLDQGAIRIGDQEHLGRLFERAPSIDRHAVLVITELMNDECVAWLARQSIRAVNATPYQHHPSGVHRWNRPIDALDLVAGEPLPAPSTAAEPIQITPPEPRFGASDDDDVVQWNEPAWFDRSLSYRPDDATDRRTEAPGEDAAHGNDDEFVVALDDEDVEPLSIDRDWIDRLADHGLPDSQNPLTPTSRLSPMAAESSDRFEVIWPSGRIDDFDATETAAPDGDPDHDRVGPTARVTPRALADVRRPTPRPDLPVAGAATEVGASETPAGHDTAKPPERVDIWGTAGDPTPSWESAIAEPVAPSAPAGTSATAHLEPVVEPTAEPPAATAPTAATAETAQADALAVRRAVASIDTGSLAARRRIADETGADPASRGVDPVLPSRVAAKIEPIVRTATGVGPVRSVFDDEPAASAPPITPAAEPVTETEPERAGRASALRRLISGLRRS